MLTVGEFYGYAGWSANGAARGPNGGVGVAATGVVGALTLALPAWLATVATRITATGPAGGGFYNGTTTFDGFSGFSGPTWGYGGVAGPAVAAGLTAGLVGCLRGLRASAPVGVGAPGTGAHVTAAITAASVEALGAALSAAHRSAGVPGGLDPRQYQEWARAVAAVVATGRGVGVVTGPPGSAGSAGSVTVGAAGSYVYSP